VAGSTPAGPTRPDRRPPVGDQLKGRVSVAFFSREPLEQAQHDLHSHEQAIADLRGSLEGVRWQMRTLASQVDDLKAALVALANEVDFHQHELADITDVGTATLLTTVQRTSERLDELELRGDETNERLRQLQAHVDALSVTTAHPASPVSAPAPTEPPPWPPPVANG
jgi:septal ring factor EnvC (AmiA/AmiB activator)